MSVRVPALLAVGVVSLVACASEPTDTAEPLRIIAVAPSAVESLFLLGLEERVVGVGDYARFPPETENKQRIGGLYDAQLETIVGLQPDLAVLLPSERELALQLQTLGIPVLEVPHESIADIERSIRLIGARTGAGERAEIVLEDWSTQLSPRALAGTPRVVLAVARQQGDLADILVAGPGTFLDELIARLGAVNVFADAPLLYPQVGLESVLERRPDVLIELQPEVLSTAARKAVLDDWLEAPGSVDMCVRIIEGDHTLLPGPRLPRLYRELETAIGSCAGGLAAPGPEQPGRPR